MQNKTEEISKDYTQISYIKFDKRNNENLNNVRLYLNHDKQGLKILCFRFYLYYEDKTVVVQHVLFLSRYNALEMFLNGIIQENGST